MKKLRAYLNTLSVPQQHEFATRCGTSLGYLRKAVCVDAKIGTPLCIRIARESGGALTCEDLRPDIDWAFIRGTAAASGK